MIIVYDATTTRNSDSNNNKNCDIISLLLFRVRHAQLLSNNTNVKRKQQ